MESPLRTALPTANMWNTVEYHQTHCTRMENCQTHGSRTERMAQAWRNASPSETHGAYMEYRWVPLDLRRMYELPLSIVRPTAIVWSTVEDCQTPGVLKYHWVLPNHGTCVGYCWVPPDRRYTLEVPLRIVKPATHAWRTARPTAARAYA